MIDEIETISPLLLMRLGEKERERMERAGKRESEEREGRRERERGEAGRSSLSLSQGHSESGSESD
jgi:hypothetical protein